MESEYFQVRNPEALNDFMLTRLDILEVDSKKHMVKDLTFFEELRNVWENCKTFDLRIYKNNKMTVYHYYNK